MRLTHLFPIVCIALGLATPAKSHDIWLNAREYNRSTGFPCCGGDPVQGDCEGLTEDQIWDKPNGDVEIFSGRYQARITIPADRIMTDLPRYTTGEQKDTPLDPLVRYAAHYCGKPRPTGVAPNFRDPDPGFVTYCFFRNGGGM